MPYIILGAISQWFNNLTLEHLIAIFASIFIISVYILFCLWLHSYKKRKSLGFTPSNKKSYSDNHSGLPRLHRNYLKKHKLEPLPDSLFRRTADIEAAHYHSDRWSKNPQSYGGVDLSLFNNDLLEICCPKCDGTIIKRKNIFTKLPFYSCDSHDCDFEILDKTNIKPLKFRPVSKPESDPDATLCPSCDGVLTLVNTKATELPTYICSNFPDCNYGPTDVGILKKK